MTSQYIKINRFDGGITDDVRSERVGVCQLSKGFDALTYKHRLVPYRSSESGQDTIGRKITDFLYVSGKLFGMGRVSGTSKVAIYYKDTFTDGTWSTTSNNESTISALPVAGFFIHYKGFLYGIHLNQSVWKYDITGSAAFAEADLSLSGTVTSTGGGLVHSKDDILYLAYNTSAGPIIAKKNGASWTDSALVLPTNLTITSICEYGNYLAIACKPTLAFSGNSRVFLWDRDSTVTTLSESIDWGAGDLKVLDTIDGQLIGISLQTDSTLLFGATHSFKYYNGSPVAIEFERLTGFGFSYFTYLGQQKQKVNNRIYFLASYSRNDNGSGATGLAGVYSIGKYNVGSPLAVNLEYLPFNDSAVTSLDGFFLIGSYMFVAYTDSGGSLDGYITKTSDTSTAYTATATYETVIYNLGDSSLTKKLDAVTILTTPMPTAGQVIVKYRKDEETSWTTIMTSTTDNAISKDAVNIESTGGPLPQFKEIQFQINSTGGAVITGLNVKATVINKKPY